MIWIMAIIKKDKSIGIIYVNDLYNKKKRSRLKRVCVGTVDSYTGDIVPTCGRVKKISKRIGLIADLKISFLNSKKL